MNKAAAAYFARFLKNTGKPDYINLLPMLPPTSKDPITLVTEKHFEELTGKKAKDYKYGYVYVHYFPKDAVADKIWTAIGQANMVGGMQDMGSKTLKYLKKKFDKNPLNDEAKMEAIQQIEWIFKYLKSKSDAENFGKNGPNTTGKVGSGTVNGKEKNGGNGSVNDKDKKNGGNGSGGNGSGGNGSDGNGSGGNGGGDGDSGSFVENVMEALSNSA